MLVETLRVVLYGSVLNTATNFDQLIPGVEITASYNAVRSCRELISSIRLVVLDAEGGT